MKKPLDTAEFLASRAGEDSDFRKRLLADPRKTIEWELGVTLDEGHEIHVHEDSYSATHLVLPPRDRLSRAERAEARTGAESLEFLRRTMHDPAPPARPAVLGQPAARRFAGSPDALAEAGRETVRRGLAFLESTLDESGAWHCIRFNIADPNIPRHFERPPLFRPSAHLRLNAAGKRLPWPFAPPPGATLKTPSNIPDSGATTSICPGTWTVPRSVRLPSGPIPGSCWDETSRAYWQIVTRTGAS